MTFNRLLFVTTLVLILSGCSAKTLNNGFAVSIPAGNDTSGATPGGTSAAIPEPNYPAGALSGTTRKVGTGKTYSTLTAAVAAAGAGDVIEIDAGTYTNDFPSTLDKPLWIKGMGGMAKFTSTQTIPNRKAYLVVSANVALENLEITGATVAEADGANAAAVRHEGGDLLIYKCNFHRNQNGILGAAASGSVEIHTSRIAQNGVADEALYPSGYGYTHNIYLRVNKLSIVGSYVWAANVGHNVKSRSLETVITHSVIADGAAGTASYSIDISNGGHLKIENSVIQKGPMASNRPFIAFGMEGLTNPNHSITISSSKFFNDLGPSVSLVLVNSGPVVTSRNNTFYRMDETQVGTGAVDDTNSEAVATSPHPPSHWGPQWPNPWPTNNP